MKTSEVGRIDLNDAQATIDFLNSRIDRIVQDPQARSKFKRAIKEGNSSKYDPRCLPVNPVGSLPGKKIAFLGSSITIGAGAFNTSFVDGLEAKDKIIPYESAVSGTTLAGNEKDTYLQRLRDKLTIKNTEFDLFICQLSTNDGRKGKSVGKITKNTQAEGFDQNTTFGAIEYICQYVQRHWKCPLVFFTCLRDPDNQEYRALMDGLYQLQDKWHFYIIDLWGNQKLRRATANDPLAMVDDAHPTREGYVKLWLPIFEEKLNNILKN